MMTESSLFARAFRKVYNRGRHATETFVHATVVCCRVVCPSLQRSVASPGERAATERAEISQLSQRDAGQSETAGRPRLRLRTPRSDDPHARRREVVHGGPGAAQRHQGKTGA